MTIPRKDLGFGPGFSLVRSLQRERRRGDGNGQRYRLRSRFLYPVGRPRSRAVADGRDARAASTSTTEARMQMLLGAYKQSGNRRGHAERSGILFDLEGVVSRHRKIIAFLRDIALRVIVLYFRRA